MHHCQFYLQGFSLRSTLAGIILLPYSLGSPALGLISAYIRRWAHHITSTLQNL